MNPAASERKRKEKSPEKFCPIVRCLYRTDGSFCPKHKPLEKDFINLRREDAVDEMREVQRDLEQEHDRG